MKSLKKADVVVIGAGAAGMMCAAVAAAKGKHVILIDHASKLAEKIRISGGGRCNFTNLYASPANYISENPRFCRSALARYTPQDFLKLLSQYQIRWHEKHKGQLFCDDSSQQIIDMLADECDKAGVKWSMETSVLNIDQSEAGWLVETSAGSILVNSIVIATGGMAIPKIGATDFGLKLARQYKVKVVEPRPALVPLTFAQDVWQPFVELAGISLEVNIRSSSGGEFREDLLFTHRGLSGPAVLQISSYWQHGDALLINLLPEVDLSSWLIERKLGCKQQINTVMSELLPRRLLEFWLSKHGLMNKVLADISDKSLRQLGQSLNQWAVIPNGSEGFKKAEVMRGGVDTKELDSKTMMVKKLEGLYFIGEAVDVTGWLGGYNFQWAWASAQAAGQAV